MKVKDQSGVKATRTVCILPCGEACGAWGHVRNGELIKMEPADFPEPGHFYMCRKGISTSKMVHHPDRLKYPLKRVGERGEGKWERISWDEAMETITGKLKDISAKYGPESLAMLGGGLSLPNGTLFIGQRFASVSGATWVSPHACGLAGQQCADVPGFGTRWAIPYLEDHKDPQMCVFWGSNTIATFPWKYRRRIRPVRDKGARIVTVGPLFNSTAAKADEWIPIRPGTDPALILGMINVIMGEGLCDEAFLIEHTVAPFLVRSDNGLFLREEDLSSSGSTGKHTDQHSGEGHTDAGQFTPGAEAVTNKYIIWDTKANKPRVYDTPGVAPALRESYNVNGIDCKPAFQLLVELAKQYPLDKVSGITEIAPDVIRRFALDYATLKPVVTERGLSLSRSFHGDLTYRAINLLAAVTGNICLDRPEADPFSFLNWGEFFFPEGNMYKQIQSYPFYENHKTGKPYPLKALWISSHNPANSHPNSNNFKELLRSMELVIVVEIFMSTTAEYADIVLPGCTPAECTNLGLPWTAFWGGGHPYFQLQPKMIEPLHEARADLEIITDLAQRMGYGKFFEKDAEGYIEMLLSSGHPTLEGITLENLRKEPRKPKPHTIPLFYTSSGRYEFYRENLKEFGQELPVYLESPESDRQPRAQKYPLHLIHTHSRAHFHSMLSNVDWLRELDPEPALGMNPVDAEKRGIQDGDMVETFNDRGMMKLKTMVHEGVRPGVVTVNEGWQPRHFAEGSYQELTGTNANPAQKAAFQPVGQINDILVEVKKA